ncbi:virulence RhuM family protein [Bifidobacterium imperatoris]|uniref:DNA-binding protein n=2 Tax=Bifidobacterium imperatoris TaxID=2020965 RepID=A0A2N5IPA2_9BIFI|nr:DNA-binding protein [Bifidobacterium imperatoris]QSY58712.1 virulence RhuM family protein [Bifidobacterium imperatoris]QSY58907.1 virulence RhuM family protein [Bifidobacterium imperatoris]
MSEKREPQEGSIVLYQADGRNVPVQVTYEDETFWMPQKQMAELFAVSVPTINEHLKNIYETAELQPDSTIRKFRIVRQEGSRQVAREVAFYNLDAIIAVGYRVNSKQADVKAKSELARYNQSSIDQLSDFEKFARGINPR